MTFLKSASILAAAFGVFTVVSCNSSAVTEEDVKKYDTLLESATIEKIDTSKIKKLTEFELAVQAAKNEKWIQYSDPAGKYSLYYPYKPTATTTGNSTTVQYKTADNSIQFWMSYTDYKSVDAAAFKAQEKELEKERLNSFFKNFAITPSTPKEITMKNGHTGFTAKGADFKASQYIKYKVIAVDNRIYQIATSKQGSYHEEEAGIFFGSFNIK